MASPTQDLQSPLSVVQDTNGQESSAESTNEAVSADDLNSVDNLPGTIQSPAQSHLHPQSAKAADQFPSQAATPNPAISPQYQPRIVGGFEVDDDDDDDDDAVEDEDGSPDEKDELDVYDPSVGLDFDASKLVPAVSLDRTSQSPEQENGITPAPVQAPGSPTDISSSALPVGADATAPAQSTTLESSAQPSPPRLNVNGSVAPAVPKPRLAHDTVGILEDRIKEDPRGDTTAYLELIEELKNRNKQDDVRRVYDQYLSIFPLAVGDCFHISLSTRLTISRRSNGVPMLGMRNNMTESTPWKLCLAVLFLKCSTFNCGLCTLTTSAAATACKQVMWQDRTKSSMSPLVLPSRPSVWIKTRAVCGKITLAS